jgi:hypothetical protein
VREVLHAAHAVDLARAVHESVHLLAVAHLAAQVDHAVLDVHGDTPLRELLAAEDLALDLAGEGRIVQALLGGRAPGTGRRGAHRALCLTCVALHVLLRGLLVLAEPRDSTCRGGPE